MHLQDDFAFRELTDDEIAAVAGGEGEEIVVTATLYPYSNPHSFMGWGASYYGSSYGATYYGGGGASAPAEPNDDADGDGQPDPDIVVTGEKMTDEQKLAYDAAHDRAWWDVTFVQIFGLGALGAGGRVAAATAGVLGVLDNRTDFSDDVIDSLASEYYRLDGLDGVHDGWSEIDRSYHYMERFPGY